jgi:hypothetical protein
MRPLSLSNADAKLIAAAISSPLQDFAAINIHPHHAAVSGADSSLITSLMLKLLLFLPSIQALRICFPA